MVGRLLLLASLFSVGGSSSCASLTINVTAPVQTTSPKFASWTVDPSRNRLFFNQNFSDPRLLYLAKEIGGSGLIRFGGGGADTLTYGGFGGLPPCDSTPQPNHYECLNKSTLDALVGLSVHTGNQLVFGLNIVPLSPSLGPPTGPWNTTGARGVLEYLRDTHPGALFGVELGNERNHNGFTATQQSACFDALGGLLAELWPDPGQGRPALIGPDADGAGNSASPAPMITYLAEFAQLQSTRLLAVTHHEYLQVDSSSVLNASYLDRTGEIGRAVVAGVRGGGVGTPTLMPIWGGEVGPHTGNSEGDGLAGTCGGNLLCGRFGSAIWYADSLASKALAGYDVYFRQDLVGASYALVNTSVPGQPPPATYFGGATPSADYYLLCLWKRLVGTRVLGVTTTLPGVPLLPPRTYAFCTPSSTPTSLTLVVINLNVSEPTCLQLPPFVPPSTPLTYYTLTPGDAAMGVESWGVRLNGVPLELSAEGLLPDLGGMVVMPGEGGIQLPPLSVSFVVLPSASTLSACAEGGAGGVAWDQ